MRDMTSYAPIWLYSNRIYREHGTMHSNLLFAVIVTAALASGCASITGTNTQSISVETRDQGGTQVTGAACELSNNKGKWFVTSPGSVMIHRSNDDMQVLCNKSGLEPGRAAVVSDTKGSMFGNILFGGGIGAIIDHNSGSAYEYPTLIQVLMGAFSKIETPKQQSPSDAQSGNPEPKPQTAASSQVAARSPTDVRSKEERLKELKVLYEKGLIAESAYTDQQKKILAD
jgi:hypothetical protein